MKVMFLDYQFFLCFSHEDIHEHNKQFHGKRKNRNVKRQNRHVFTFSDLSIILHFHV